MFGLLTVGNHQLVILSVGTYGSSYAKPRKKSGNKFCPDIAY
jgi:hypothetical protein